MLLQHSINHFHINIFKTFSNNNLIYTRFKSIFQELFPYLFFLNYFQVNLKTANNIKLIIPFNFISNKNNFLLMTNDSFNISKKNSFSLIVKY